MRMLSKRRGKLLPLWSKSPVVDFRFCWFLQAEQVRAADNVVTTATAMTGAVDVDYKGFHVGMGASRVCSDVTCKCCKHSPLGGLPVFFMIDSLSRALSKMNACVYFMTTLPDKNFNYAVRLDKSTLTMYMFTMSGSYVKAMEIDHSARRFFVSYKR